MSDAEDLVRQAVELFMAGRTDEAWATWADDAIGFPPKDWPEASKMEGRDEIRERFESFGDAFGPEWARRLSIEQVTDAGEGRVLVEFDWEPRGIESGLTIEQPLAGLYTVRDGRIVRGDFFTTHEEARRAAGLT
jgi:ketosteroid isomerase-like protein